MLTQAGQQGRSTRRADAYPLWYVETLSEASTPLAACFSILIGYRIEKDHLVGGVVGGGTALKSAGDDFLVADKRSRERAQE
jgi:hypothetical protein